MNTKIIKSGDYEIEITIDRSGRTSIVIKTEPFDYRGNGKTLIDVELPAETGEFKNAFEPVVKVAKGIEITTIDGGFLVANV